jgi:hypothetical protein
VQFVGGGVEVEVPPEQLEAWVELVARRDDRPDEGDLTEPTGQQLHEAERDDGAAGAGLHRGEEQAGRHWGAPWWGVTSHASHPTPSPTRPPGTQWPSLPTLDDVLGREAQGR